MAGNFVPFFEKATSGDSLPQYQFSQYKVSRVTLAKPPQTVRRLDVDRHELKAKALSDLRNAVNLSLPPDALQQFVSDLDQFRASEKSILDTLEPHSSLGDGGLIDAGEKPKIKLQKDGDKVTNIMVECECGQVIALDCVY